MLRSTLMTGFLLLTIGFTTPSLSQTVEPAAISEEVVENRAKEVGKQLRCVVCKNVSIEDSDATMAADMRNIVRAKIRDGASNDEVIDYMKTKYGDFVLMNTPFNIYTGLVWLLPFFLLIIATIWFVRKTRQYSSGTDTDLT